MLLLIWPPLDNPMAFKALTLFTGNYLIYIGEEEYGSTGSYRFFRELEKNWIIMNHIKTPNFKNWDGVHDKVIFYERKIHNPKPDNKKCIIFYIN